MAETKNTKDNEFEISRKLFEKGLSEFNNKNYTEVDKNKNLLNLLFFFIKFLKIIKYKF